MEYKPQRARNQVFFFAWLNDHGEIEKQRGYKNSRPLSIAKRSADWLCVSTFRSAWYVKEDGARRFGKQKENIHSINCSFLDLDFEGEIDINADVITHRCNALGIPHPSFIIRTSPNHYHVMWQYRKPIVLNKRELLGYWEAVQKTLFEGFKDLGADVNCLDATRYLRNPYNLKAVNRKYPNAPRVEIEHEGGATSLNELHRALRSADLPQTSARGHVMPSHGLPFRISFARVKRFLADNPGVVGTYRELADYLRIPERSFYHITKCLREEGQLETERLREGRTWATRFVLILQAKVNTSSGGDEITLREVLEAVAERGAPPGFRNEAYFILTLFLRLRLSLRLEECFNYLSLGHHKTAQGGHGFSRREFDKVVRSAFRPEYKYFFSSHHQKIKKFFSLFPQIQYNYH